MLVCRLDYFSHSAYGYRKTGWALAKERKETTRTKKKIKCSIWLRHKHFLHKVFTFFFSAQNVPTYFCPFIHSQNFYPFCSLSLIFSFYFSILNWIYDYGRHHFCSFRFFFCRHRYQDRKRNQRGTIIHRFYFCFSFVDFPWSLGFNV